MRSKQSVVDAFFAAYQKHDLEAIKRVMDENVTWSFPGNHPFAGIKKGIPEVVAFFDKVGAVMMASKRTIDKLIVAENEHYLIECIHSKTNRSDNNNLEHYASVLWTFKDDKIIEGKHFFADQQAIDKYFTAVAS
jgi:ketosteroid isomerase-like protein